MNAYDTECQLMREGARAAERGGSWQSNPYLNPQNMPACTGDSPQEWSRKHDAWQRGFESQGNLDNCKEQLSMGMLLELVTSRVRMIPLVASTVKGGATLRVAFPIRHTRDQRWRNWDLDEFECGALRVHDCETEFRCIVEELRLRYDVG